MNPVLQETVIRFGGVEAFTEAVNGRIRELETQQGIPPERSHGNVHPATVRAWLRGARPRFAVRAQAVCDLAGRTTQRVWGRDTLDDVNRREFLTQAIGGIGATALAGAILPIIAELGAAPDADPEAYARRCAELWAGCWTAEPVDLAYAAADHAEYGSNPPQPLEGQGPPAHRRRHGLDHDPGRASSLLRSRSIPDGTRRLERR
jgi:hypothetical protein